MPRIRFKSCSCDGSLDQSHVFQIRPTKTSSHADLAEGPCTCRPSQIPTVPDMSCLRARTVTWEPHDSNHILNETNHTAFHDPISRGHVPRVSKWAVGEGHCSQVHESPSLGSGVNLGKLVCGRLCPELGSRFC